MGSENSKSGLEKPVKPVENQENSINFLNSNNSISPKTNEKTKYSRYDATDTMENKLIQISFRWVDGGSVVYVTGTFTNWRNHILMNHVINEFQLVLSLSPGVYEYKYIVDGVWKYSTHDPTINDSHGNTNNFVDTDAVERKNQMLNHLNSGGSRKEGDFFGQFETNPYKFTQKQTDSDIMDEKTQATTGKKAGIKTLPIKNESSNLKIDANMQNAENNFNEEAPEIPSHLLNIPFLIEKEQKIGVFWKIPLPKMEIEFEVTPCSSQEEKNMAYLRCFEPFNNLKPPTHVVINHMGIKNKNPRNYLSYCYTQRYKGKYATLKFYTLK